MPIFNHQRAIVYNNQSPGLSTLKTAFREMLEAVPAYLLNEVVGLPPTSTVTTSHIVASLSTWLSWAETSTAAMCLNLIHEECERMNDRGYRERLAQNPSAVKGPINYPTPVKNLVRLFQKSLTSAQAELMICAHFLNNDPPLVRVVIPVSGDGVRVDIDPCPIDIAPITQGPVVIGPWKLAQLEAKALIAKAARHRLVEIFKLSLENPNNYTDMVKQSIETADYDAGNDELNILFHDMVRGISPGFDGMSIAAKFECAELLQKTNQWFRLVDRLSVVSGLPEFAPERILSYVLDNIRPPVGFGAYEELILEVAEVLENIKLRETTSEMGLPLIQYIETRFKTLERAIFQESRSLRSNFFSLERRTISLIETRLNAISETLGNLSGQHDFLSTPLYPVAGGQGQQNFANLVSQRVIQVIEPLVQQLNASAATGRASTAYVAARIATAVRPIVVGRPVSEPIRATFLQPPPPIIQQPPESQNTRHFQRNVDSGLSLGLGGHFNANPVYSSIQLEIKAPMLSGEGWAERLRPSIRLVCRMEIGNLNFVKGFGGHVFAKGSYVGSFIYEYGRTKSSFYIRKTIRLPLAEFMPNTLPTCDLALTSFKNQSMGEDSPRFYISPIFEGNQRLSIRNLDVSPLIHFPISINRNNGKSRSTLDELKPTALSKTKAVELKEGAKNHEILTIPVEKTPVQGLSSLPSTPPARQPVIDKATFSIVSLLVVGIIGFFVIIRKKRS